VSVQITGVSSAPGPFWKIANAGVTSYLGNGASGILVWGAQVEINSTATDYQKVVSQYDVTEAGVSDVYYLAFDGVDDSLATASINFSATDEMSVFAGVRKLSDAATSVVYESAAGPVNNSVTLFAPDGTTSYRYRSRGTALQSADALGFAAPDTRVLTGLSKISAPSVSLRVDGTVVSTNTDPQGTGNLANAISYIGRRAGSSLPFNGRIYSLIVRGLLTSGDDLTNAETYVAGETGFTAPSITGLPTIGVSL
jgi:hypothetical protein